MPFGSGRRLERSSRARYSAFELDSVRLGCSSMYFIYVRAAKHWGGKLNSITPKLMSSRRREPVKKSPCSNKSNFLTVSFEIVDLSSFGMLSDKRRLDAWFFLFFWLLWFWAPFILLFLGEYARSFLIRSKSHRSLHSSTFGNPWKHHSQQQWTRKSDFSYHLAISPVCNALVGLLPEPLFFFWSMERV